MTRFYQFPICLVMLLLAIMCPPVSAQIAVVVHPDNPMTDVSLDNLRRIYLGKVTTFESHVPVVLTENAELDEEFYKIVTDMSLRRIRQHWMKMVFEGAFATPPAAFEEQAELERFIGRNPGAIGFMELSAADSTLKTLTVEGLDLRSEDYPLQVDRLAEKSE